MCNKLKQDRADGQQRIRRVIAGVLATLLLVGCVTPYQPARRRDRRGYTDARLDANTYLVTFRGNGHTSRETVEIYLLYRCAEVTRNAGMDYFIIQSGDTETSRMAYSTPGTYTAPTQHMPGTFTPGISVPITRYGGTATIKVFRGTKPEDPPGAYQAADLLRYLGPKIRR